MAFLIGGRLPSLCHVLASPSLSQTSSNAKALSTAEVRYHNDGHGGTLLSVQSRGDGA